MERLGPHCLGGNGTIGHFLHLLVQHIHGGLGLDDEIANQHTKGDQYPAVGQGSQNLAQIIAGRHKAHISTSQKQNQPDISIKQADQNFAQRFAAHVQDGKLINAKKRP